MSKKKNGARARSDHDVLALNFPAYREIYREFREIGPTRTESSGKTAINSVVCCKIPYSSKQGINSTYQGRIPA